MNKNNFDFTQKLNSSQLRLKAIRHVNEICNFEELKIRKNISERELEKLIELSYTTAWLENYSDLDFSNDNFENEYQNLVQCMFDVIVKYTINKVIKRGL